MRVAHGNGLAPATRRLLIAAIAIGLMHHIDHVLRVDHSGWPFRRDVNPFTYSLVAYPVLLFALLGPARAIWWRWGGLAVGTVFTLFAHVRIETPQMQYAMWAYNRSLEPRLWSIRNLCGVESDAMGWIAVVVAMVLNVLLVTATVAVLRDALDATARRRAADSTG